MLSTKRLKEKLKVHQIQSTPFHLLHKFWNIYFNFFFSWFLKMFHLITGIEGVPLFPRQHEKGELQTLVWPFWPLSIFLFIWFFFSFVTSLEFPWFKGSCFKIKKKTLLWSYCICSPTRWGPVGPTFDQCSPFDTCHQMSLYEAQFYTHRTFTHCWIGSLKKCMVKTPLNFKDVKLRASIIWHGWLFWKIFPSTLPPLTEMRLGGPHELDHIWTVCSMPTGEKF